MIELGQLYFFVAIDACIVSVLKNWYSCDESIFVELNNVVALLLHII